MHLDSGKRFRFDPETWQANGQRKFKSDKEKSRHREKSRIFTFEEYSHSNLSIRTPPPKRHRKRTNSGLDDSPRASKSPRVSSHPESTGLTPRLAAASIDREISPLAAASIDREISPPERQRRKLRQPDI